MLNLTHARTAWRACAGNSFTVISGPCTATGACVTSPNFPSNYGNNQACSIRANENGELRADAFSTESGYDTLTIGSTEYGGSSGPVNVSIDPATSMDWASDESVAESGWKLCLAFGESFRMQNTWIGLAADGLAPIGNKGHGIFVTAPQQTIGVGSYRDASGPVIVSGNKLDGIRAAPSAAGLAVLGCWIGLAADGKTAAGNDLNGVRVAAPHSTLGNSIGKGSDFVLVAGNGEAGVLVELSASNFAMVKSWVGLAADGVKAVPNKGVGVSLAAPKCRLGPDAATSYVYGAHNVISANGGAGVKLLQSAVGSEVFHTWIGLDSEGKVAVGNAEDGISIAAPNCTIGGSHAGDGDARTLISGNHGDGVFVAETAHRLSIVSTWAGLGQDGQTAVGNLGDGIRFNAPDCAMGGDGSVGARVVVSANDGNGVTVHSTATDIDITNTFVGLLTDGATLAGNKRNGISVDAERCRIGGRNNAGAAAAAGGGGSGSSSGSDSGSGSGITGGAAPASQIAIPGRFGDRTSTAVPSLMIISGNHRAGVLARRNAAYLIVAHAWIGLTSSGLVTVGNGDDGIRIERYCDNVDVLHSVISGNTGNGIAIVGGPATIVNSTIGLDVDELEPLGNSADGVRLESEAMAVSILGNHIGGNHLHPIRNLAVANPNALFPNNIIPPTTSHLANGRDFVACTRCVCSNATHFRGGTKVDCRESTLRGNGRLKAAASFRPIAGDFPTLLPQITTTLHLASTGLSQIDWGELERGARQLKVLDLSGNPELDPIPPSGYFDRDHFPVLASINLGGTNLRRLTNGTFASLNRELLDALDLSNPSHPPPLTTTVDLSGFSAPLGAVLWYAADKCPPGYYATSELSGLALCARCPLGTFKPSQGGGINSCVDCGSFGTANNRHIDHDDDPVTSCHPPLFGINLTLNWDPAAGPPPLHLKRITINKTYTVRPPTVTRRTLFVDPARGNFAEMLQHVIGHLRGALCSKISESIRRHVHRV